MSLLMDALRRAEKARQAEAERSGEADATVEARADDELSNTSSDTAASELDRNQQSMSADLAGSAVADHERSLELSLDPIEETGELPNGGSGLAGAGRNLPPPPPSASGYSMEDSASLELEPAPEFDPPPRPLDDSDDFELALMDDGTLDALPPDDTGATLPSVRAVRDSVDEYFDGSGSSSMTLPSMEETGEFAQAGGPGEDSPGGDSLDSFELPRESSGDPAMDTTVTGLAGVAGRRGAADRRGERGEFTEESIEQTSASTTQRQAQAVVAASRVHGRSGTKTALLSVFCVLFVGLLGTGVYLNWTTLERIFFGGPSVIARRPPPPTDQTPPRREQVAQGADTGTASSGGEGATGAGAANSAPEGLTATSAAATTNTSSATASGATASSATESGAAQTAGTAGEDQSAIREQMRARLEEAGITPGSNPSAALGTSDASSSGSNLAGAGAANDEGASRPDTSRPDSRASDSAPVDPALRGRTILPDSAMRREALATSEPSSSESAVPRATERASSASPAQARAPRAPLGAVPGLSIRKSGNVGSRQRLLRAGYQALSSNRIDTASRAYRDVLRLDPRNRDALLGVAAVHVKRQEFRSAVGIYQKLLRNNPKDSAAQAGLLALRQGGDPVSEESRVKSLLAQEPERAYLHFGLGNLYAQQRRWPEAQQAYFEAFKRASGNADYAFNLAISLDRLGQRSAALDYYRKALDLAASGGAGFSRAAAQDRVQALAARASGRQ